MHIYLEFEKNIADLEGKIEELKHMTSDGEVNIASEVDNLQKKLENLLKNKYENLTPWQRIQVARHPNRPHFKDYVEAMIADFTPLAGDRNFANDNSLICGFGRYKGRSVVIIGHEKGSDFESRMKHNFGSSRPEGYRKAQRIMSMAEHFSLPIISLVDTAGAYPGVGAEERGQAEAIASTIDKGLSVRVPFICVLIGEGGSGGAIAITTGDTIHMLENSIYTVISPEGCASILWRSTTYAQDAAESLKMTAKDLYKLRIIDEIIKEPLGGAHRDKQKTITSVSATIHKSLKELSAISTNTLVENRAKKFLAMGR